MTKGIKFNLICKGYPVRTLEELLEHFDINDILEYYKGEDHLLLRWLKLREYINEYQKVQAIKEKDDKKILLELAKIFGVDLDVEDIDDYYRSEAYRKEKYSRNTEAVKADSSMNAVVENYISGYNKQLEALLSNDPQDKRFAFEKLTSEYTWALELDIENVIKRFIDTSTIDIIIDFLLNPVTRQLIVDSDGNLEYGLKEWFPNNFTKEEAKKYGLQMIKDYGGGENKEIILEPAGVHCLVIDSDYNGYITSVKGSKWLNYTSVQVGKIYNGLKIKDRYSWKSNVTYIIID